MGFEPPVPCDAFLGLKFEDKESWWGDGLFGPQYRLMISGRGGCKKSFFTLGLALAFASNTTEEYVGFPIENGKKVLYLNFEINKPGLQKRLSDMTKNIAHEEIANLHITNSFDFNIEDQDDRFALFEYATNHNIDILIFDCLYKMHNREENDSTDMKNVLNYLDAFIANGMSVILIHHHGKHSDEERGSSVMRDWVDTSIGLKNNTVYFNKVRHDVEPEKIRIDWDANKIFQLSDGHAIATSAQKITDQLIISILDREKLDRISQKALGDKIEELQIAKSSSVRKYKTGDLVEGYVENAKKYYRKRTVKVS